MMLATQLGSPAAAAEPTTDQLSTISSLLERNDVEGLRAFISSHPELAEGTTPLAALLRRFQVESVGGNDFFRYRNRTDDGGPNDGQATDSPGGSPGAGY
jgi:hypothetical protein